MRALRFARVAQRRLLDVELQDLEHALLRLAAGAPANLTTPAATIAPMRIGDGPRRTTQQKLLEMAHMLHRHPSSRVSTMAKSARARAPAHAAKSTKQHPLATSA